MKRSLWGYHKNKEGDDSLKNRLMREFAKSLQDEHKIDIEFVDERFSTVAATKQLHGLNIQSQRATKNNRYSSCHVFYKAYLIEKARYYGNSA